MSPEDARMHHLRAELQREWDQARAHLARAQSVDPAAGDPEAALVALSLDHAYQAFESLLLRLERAIGLAERVGPAWHMSLLADACLELPGVRPPVYPEQARHEWEALLRFRHFLRHAYAVPLDPGELTRTRGHLERAVAQTERTVEALLSSLD